MTSLARGKKLSAVKLAILAVIVFGLFFALACNRSTGPSDQPRSSEEVVAHGAQAPLVGVSLPLGTVQWHLDEGEELARQGRLDEAIKEFTKAIELDPLFAETYNGRGLVYSSLSQFERAIKDYDQAISLNPQYAEAYYNRGLAYFYLGQFERAIREYDRAIFLDPQYAVAYANRARSYTLLGMDAEAQQDVNQAVELGFAREFLDTEIEKLQRRP